MSESFAVGDKAEWNPAEGVWIAASVTHVLEPGHVGLELNDGSGEILRAQTRHLRRAGGVS
jgi:hypothetical protein